MQHPQRKAQAVTLAQIAAENDWKNDMVLWVLPLELRAAMPRIVNSWVRNYLMCLGLFVGVAAVWACCIYGVAGAQLFRGRGRPSLRAMARQVSVWCTAIPLYAVMPASIEWAAEQGWTRAYSRVADVGLGWHVLYFAAFMASVEAGVYAMHRSLHDVRLYRSLHHIHHQYNKQDALSPFAGLAFHPLDGIMQALPYCWTLLLIPMHFMTFELLLLATGLWTTNIHDTVDMGVKPLLAAGHHTIHHVTYKHNYGHYTTFMDALCGTLMSPAQYEARKARKAS
jgi:lathosterol oxidase